MEREEGNTPKEVASFCSNYLEYGSYEIKKGQENEGTENLDENMDQHHQTEINIGPDPKEVQDDLAT